jgi:HK97 family phage major capsid protein
MPLAIAGRVRAEGPDVAGIIAELQAGFSDFKNKHNERLAEIEASLDGQMAAVAAQRLGGAPGARRLSDDVLGSLRSEMRGQPRASMSTQSDPDGGYTVVPELDQTIAGVVRSYSPMRQLANVVVQQPGTGDWEKILATRGSQSGWTGEENDRDDGDGPQFGKVTITAHEVYAIPSLTNHLLDDSSFDLQAFLETDVAGEFALREGAAFVNGDGINKPRGFLMNPTSTANDDVRPFGTLQYLGTGTAGAFPASNPGDKLKDLLALVPAPYRQGPGVAFMMNSATANTISKFKDGQGNYLWTQSVIVGQPDSLLGYPVAINEDMPDIAANSMSVAFGNFRLGYGIVDKLGIKLVVDKVTRKGWTKLYFAKRTGGGTLDTRAIKLLKFA